MNTFQQQYLSVLGAATGRKFLQAAETTADAASDWIEQNTGNNVSYNKETDAYKVSKSAEKWEKTGLTLDDASIIDDIAERGLKSMPKGEARDTFRYGMEEIQQRYRGQYEELQGLRAQMESKQAIKNKSAAKPHKMTNKEFAKEFYKRAKPIPHGGKK